MLLGFSGDGNNHDTLDILRLFTQLGIDQFSAFFHLWANSIKFFHIGHAHSSQFHLLLSCFQSVFPDHTTVVICGVYHAVQMLLGNICFHHHFIYCFVDVHVFAATFLQLRLR